MFSCYLLFSICFGSPTPCHSTRVTPTPYTVQSGVASPKLSCLCPVYLVFSARRSIMCSYDACLVNYLLASAVLAVVLTGRRHSPRRTHSRSTCSRERSQIRSAHSRASRSAMRHNSTTNRTHTSIANVRLITPHPRPCTQNVGI